MALTRLWLHGTAWALMDMGARPCSQEDMYNDLDAALKGLEAPVQRVSHGFEQSTVGKQKCLEAAQLLNMGGMRPKVMHTTLIMSGLQRQGQVTLEDKLQAKDLHIPSPVRQSATEHPRRSLR